MTPGQQGIQYDLSQVYTTFFGTLRPPYPTLVLDSKQVKLSPVGTARALRGAFKFSSGISGTEFSMPTKIAGYQLPNEPTIRIRGGKEIIETKITRLDPVGFLNRQNVLEEINLNNYNIRIRGLLINENDPDDYPEEQLRALREVVTQSGSVAIENAILTMWGITQIAIYDFDFPECRGMAVQPYEIIGTSDELVDLELVERSESVQ